MAITISLYSKFQKRVNSTKIPSGTKRDFEVTLKSDTSRYYPTFDLHTGVDISQYNYVEWDGRYYYVKDIIYYRHNSYYVQCEIDVMTSWRANILATTAFIIYSQSSYNSDIIDTRLGLTASVSKKIGVTMELPSYNISGCFVVEVAGYNNGTAYSPTAQYFVVNANVLKALNQKIFGMDKTIQEDLQNFFGGNLTTAITEVKHFPLDAAAISGTNAEITIGIYQSGITAPTLSAPVISTTKEITFTKPYSDWRGISCCKYWINLPGIPLVEVDAALVMRTDLQLAISYDMLSGDVVYTLFDVDAKKSVFKGSASLAQDVRTSVYGSNKIEQIGSMITHSIQSIVDFVVPSKHGEVDIINNFGFAKEISARGNVGGYASVIADHWIYTVTEYVNTSANPSSINSTIGRPAFKQGKIGDLSGRVQTLNASVQADAPQEFLDYINNTLDGGAFIE